MTDELKDLVEGDYVWWRRGDSGWRRGVLSSPIVDGDVCVRDVGAFRLANRNVRRYGPSFAFLEKCRKAISNDFWPKQLFAELIDTLEEPKD